MKKKKTSKGKRTDSIRLNDVKNLQNYIDKFAKRNNISFEDVLKIFDSKEKLPIEIFSTKLSPLESVVKHLRQNLRLPYKEISGLLNKDISSCWTAYKNAIKKSPELIITSPSKYDIPLNSLSSDKLSLLELITSYLKDELKLSYRLIGDLLQRDQRTIWTVYNRAKKKL